MSIEDDVDQGSVPEPVAAILILHALLSRGILDGISVPIVPPSDNMSAQQLMLIRAARKRVVATAWGMAGYFTEASEEAAQRRREKEAEEAAEEAALDRPDL
jgi:hypothetical protein